MRPDSINDKDNNQITQKQSSPRSELRLRVELFSLTAIFLLTSIIAFSPQKDEIEISSFSFTLPYNHEVLFALGCIYGALCLTSLILMFLPLQAKRLGDWVECSTSNLNKIFWGFFWPFLWIALSITFITGLVDASSRMPTANWRGITLLAGVFLYLVATIVLIGRGFKRKRRLKK